VCVSKHHSAITTETGVLVENNARTLCDIFKIGFMSDVQFYRIFFVMSRKNANKKLMKNLSFFCTIKVIIL